MYYKCDISIVVTNSYFTDAAIDLAKSTGTILWDYDDLVKLEKQAILDSKKKQRDPCLYNNERATCDDDERSELFWSEDEY